VSDVASKGVSTTASATCLLLVGDRVVLRATAPPEAEYAMFEIGEIELRASEPGRVREHGYQTTAEHARVRLGHLGITADLAREFAQAMQPVLSDAYARGGAVRRVARYLGAAELLQSDAYDGSVHAYRGVFLDLATLAGDLDIEHTGATLHALFLASILETEAAETTILLSTDACTKGAKPGARTYRRPAFADTHRLLNAIGGLSHHNPKPKIHEALPRADVIAFLRTRADVAPDEDARALYKSLESSVSLRDMPDRGPLAFPDLWAIETRIENGELDGTIEAIDEAERRHGRTPGTTYLRARVSLALRLEQPKLIAERVSAFALSMTSFQELALLAAEAWLDAGDPRRAMPYARDLVDAFGVDEGLLLRAQRLLARAVGAAPQKKHETIADVPSSPQPSRPPSSAPPDFAALAASEMAAALVGVDPVEAPLDPDEAIPELATPELATPPASLPPPIPNPLPLPVPPPLRPSRGVPPPLPASRPPADHPRSAPPLPSSRRLPAMKPLPLPREPSAPPLEPPILRHRLTSGSPTDDDREPSPLTRNRRSDRPNPPGVGGLWGKTPAVGTPRTTGDPPRDVELQDLDPAASFTLDLPGPGAPATPEGLRKPASTAAPESPRPAPSRRPRLSGVMMETRPPASFDPRAEPDSPIVPHTRSSATSSAPPAGRPRAARSGRASPSPPASAHPTPLRPPSGPARKNVTPSAPPLDLGQVLEASGLELATPEVTPSPPAPIAGGDSQSYMHGASLPPYRHESPAPLLPRAPLLPKLGGTADELAEHLPLPPGIGGEPRSLDVLPTSVLEARVQFTLLARELGLDYRLKRGIDLRADVSGIEAMQSVLLESFPEHVVKTSDEAYELRRHGALLSEILARRLDAEWLDISPNELGYWVMIVPPDTRVWPFGRVLRLIAMGHKERDLVSYFLELQTRARGR
jgi:hypothetical protein